MGNGDAGDPGDALDGGLEGVADLELQNDLDRGGHKAHGDGHTFRHAGGGAQVVGEHGGKQLGPAVPKVHVQGVGELEQQHDEVDHHEQREAEHAQRPGPSDGRERRPAHVHRRQRDARSLCQALGCRGDGAGHEVDEHVHAGEGDAQGQSCEEGVFEAHFHDKADDEHDQGHKDGGPEAQDIVNNI